MKIKTHDTALKTLIIAEIGNNHEGHFDTALELVDLAAAAGVDAVKFQTFRTEEFVRRADVARFERLKSFELSFDQFTQLSERAHSHGLLFLSTPLDLTSAKFLNGIVDAFKIASGDFTFYPLIQNVMACQKPTILSTGLCNPDEITTTLRLIGPRQDIGLLHCVSSYPVPPAEANLRAISYLQTRFPQLTIGYSDHVTGIEASVSAAALGARIIEKHFTLGHHYSDFRDHQLSADPQEMATLVQRVRSIEAMLGQEFKIVQPSETAGREAFRRSIAAARDLPAGHQVRTEDLIWLRPGTGIAPGGETHIIGQTLTNAMKQGEFF